MGPETDLADKGTEILVVEDSQTQAMQIQLFLEENGYRVSVAHDGEEALAYLEKHKPSLVLSDILMPKMDGFELCRRIVANEALRDVPIILLSQLSKPDEIEQGLACGALAFIVKPYQKEALIRKINSMIRSASAVSRVGQENRLLVVEDSPTQAEYLRGLLEQRGFKVDLAGNGKEALALMRENRPDIVISDVLMPEMDGYEMCQEMRQSRELCNTPVVMLTSLVDPKDVIRGIVSGVDYYLTKPFEDRYLLEKINSILKGGISRGDEQIIENIDLVIGGKSYCISVSGHRLLNLLLSTYENAVSQNSALRKAHLELEEKNAQLAEEIRERTAAEEQLEKRTAELQTMVDLMAGREIRMAELKRVIKKLRAQLEEAGMTPVADDPLRESNG